MNENIDLTKILEGCPKGTKFYSSIFGEVSFVEIHNHYDKYPIELQAYNKYTHSIVEIDYAEDGRSSYIFDGECTLFPSKDQRDWSKFERFWDKSGINQRLRSLTQILCSLLIKYLLKIMKLIDGLHVYIVIQQKI